MKIAFNEKIELVLLHPVTREPLIVSGTEPAVAIVYGAHSDQYRAAKNRSLNAAMARQGSGTAEQQDADGITLLADCVEGFKHLDGLEDERGKIDTTNVRKTLKRVGWIKDQVDRAIVTDSNFLQAASETPANE